MKVILKLGILLVAVWVGSYILPSVHFPDIKSNDYTYVIMVGLVLAIFNAFIKPVIKILAFPITFMTMGLFPLILNTILIIFLEGVLNPHFVIEGSNGYPAFVWAMAFAVIISIVNYILDMIVDGLT